MVQEDSSPRLLPKVATPLSLRAAILFSGEYPNRFNCQTKTPRFRGKLFHDRQSRFPKSPIELLKPARRQSKPAQQRFRRSVMPAENFSCSLPLDGLRSIRPRIRHKKTPKKPVKTRLKLGFRTEFEIIWKNLAFGTWQSRMDIQYSASSKRIGFELWVSFWQTSNRLTVKRLLAKS